MEKPGENRREATGKSQEKAAAGNKQANPRNDKNCLFTQANVRSKSDEPTQSWDKMAFYRKKRFCKVAADQSTAGSGKQIIPVVS
jgi:hypothetical protein